MLWFFPLISYSYEIKNAVARHQIKLLLWNSEQIGTDPAITFMLCASNKIISFSVTLAPFFCLPSVQLDIISLTKLTLILVFLLHLNFLFFYQTELVCVCFNIMASQCRFSLDFFQNNMIWSHFENHSFCLSFFCSLQQENQ